MTLNLNLTELTDLPFAELSLPVWIALGLGVFFGTGLVWHRAGIQLFSRLIFPIALVFILATIMTYVKIPGIAFRLEDYLPSLRGMELDIAKAFGAGLLVASLLRILWHRRLINQGRKGQRDSGRWRSARGLYYETAIRLGVHTANADGHAEPREFEALETAFELSFFNAPHAKSLYADQLENPKPMSRVLGPFKKQFAPASPPCETLILGMATIAIADGRATKSELGLVRMAASQLGITPAHAERLITTAGIGVASEQSCASRQSALDMLGLNAEASPKQITRAYKRQAAKYAPDRLLLLAIPDAERARIETLKAQLDEAYSLLIPAA